jgi:hypothetical protein
MVSEPVQATLRVIEALEALGVPYLIGGSLASAVHGVVRTTLDADLLADLRLEHVEPLTLALGEAFYVDAESIRDAIQRRSTFNVIHLETMFKVDIFIPKPRPFDQVQLQRRTKQVIATDPEHEAYVASAEDTILAKLEWYRRGSEVSDRQWQDVLGVLKVQGNRLDLAYLRQWATSLGVSDLLEKALAEAGSTSVCL